MMLLFDNSLISFFVLNSIFSVIIFMVVWPIQHFLFKDNFKWKYALWSIVLIRLFLPIESFLGFNSFGWLLSSFEVEAEIQGLMVEETLTSVDQHFVSTQNNNFSNSVSLKTILEIGWMVGSSLFLLIFFLLRFKYKNYVNQSEISIDPAILSYVEYWKSYFQISRKVQVRLSGKASIPFTIGVFKPRIIIPKNILRNDSSVQLESIIAHEMAHIKRWDDLHILALGIVQAIYFFNPIVWLMIKELGQLREFECDRLVLQKGKISRQKYGHSLLKTISSQHNPGILFVLAMSGKKTKMKKRLTAIKGESSMNKNFNPFNYFILFLITIASLSMSNPFEKPAQENTTENASPIPAIENPFDFQKPLKDYKISSNYGMKTHPLNNLKKQHIGIDLKAPKDTKIYAAEDGEILTAKLAGGYGKQIIISHNEGYQTVYAHLNKYFVKKGQIVKRGDVIGLVGSTGLSTGPHLHFEIREDGKPVNPNNFIKF